VLYAGNIGDGQGLHHILPELAERMSGRVHFRVVGDGGRVEALREKVRARALSNVELLPPVERAELIAQYQKADVLFLHLNDFPAFRRVLPSKLFEYAATGKPIWAGVAGYSADLVSDEISNSAVFNPCDVDGAIKAFERLSLAQASRLEFVARYSRSRIMKKMANDVLELLEVRDGLN
jgi:glycosyltransferase involved in cell wall biosynthesis